MTAPPHPGMWTVARVRYTAAANRSANEVALRALNVTVAAIGIVVTAPLMFAIVLVVKLTSSGPAIYEQTRVGVNRRGSRKPVPASRRSDDIGGKPFGIFKFRTMRCDSDQAQVWASKGRSEERRVGKECRS